MRTAMSIPIGRMFRGGIEYLDGFRANELSRSHAFVNRDGLNKTETMKLKISERDTWCAICLKKMRAHPDDAPIPPRAIPAGDDPDADDRLRRMDPSVRSGAASRSVKDPGLAKDPESAKDPGAARDPGWARGRAKGPGTARGRVKGQG
jgi:hypothetical protein